MRTAQEDRSAAPGRQGYYARVSEQEALTLDQVAERPTDPDRGSVEVGGSMDSRDLDRIVEAVRVAVAAVEGRPNAAIDIRVQVVHGAVRVQALRAAPQPDGSVASETVSFASWFKGHLQDRELSHEAVARRLGVSTKTITRWVTGRTEPRFRELIEICSVFGDSPL